MHSKLPAAHAASMQRMSSRRERHRWSRSVTDGVKLTDRQTERFLDVTISGAIISRATTLSLIDCQGAQPQRRQWGRWAPFPSWDWSVWVWSRAWVSDVWQCWHFNCGTVEWLSQWHHHDGMSGSCMVWHKWLADGITKLTQCWSQSLKLSI